ncbi:MAG: AAA family ATPase [Ignavibacteriae bacterium]|nr:AAA family ATPase [Ignavibacteriota bacterium]
MAFSRASKHKPLKPEQLKLVCNPDSFDFDSTTSISPIEGIVGQERALKALKVGIDIDGPGYNIFITGLSGTGKFSSVQKLLTELLSEKSKLYDYTYVNNFRDEDHPTLLVFPAGKGRQFKIDFENAVKFFQDNIPQILDTEPFLSKRKKLIKDYGVAQKKLMTVFETKLKKDSLSLGQIKVGEVTRPELVAVIEDQAYYVQQLDELVTTKKITKRKANTIFKKYTEHQDELQNVFKETLKQTQNFHRMLNDLETSAVTDLVKVTFEELKKNYNQKKVKKYLDKAEKNIFQNLERFKQKPIPNQNPMEVAPDILYDYKVNLLLDNSRSKSTPVVIETSPSFTNLFGLIEKYNTGNGVWFTDYTKIKSGSLLKANGGYLVMKAEDAISEPGVWQTLKRVLIYGKLEIQDTASIFQITPSIIKPEPIEINCKIILIGNNYSYSLLSKHEDDFNKMFKIKAEFDYEMDRNENTLLEYARLIKKLVGKEKLLEFDKTAIAKVVEYGARYAGEKKKLTTRFSYISDLAREANFWAKDVGDSVVTKVHVRKAFYSAIERHSMHESKMKAMMKDETILIETDGVKVGQINGLAVYGGNFYSFGKPSKITASVALGNGNIINVERESGLSGSSHNKGILIITGYFREKFGKHVPLSFSANIVFEQSYGMIDGDSASVTEICALLSSISEIPIKQSFAITGSINQKGEIQPIGGVNEKVEGFFDVCKDKGLTGKQGVIIPIQNVKDLMLKDEIIDAVKNTQFAIHAISTVDEAIEILTGVKAGKQISNGRFQANTVYCLVEKRLREMRLRLKPRPVVKKEDLVKKQKSTKRKKKK